MIENFSLKYKQELPNVLDNLNLSIRSGEKVKLHFKLIRNGNNNKKMKVLFALNIDWNCGPDRSWKK
jgi:hypothetical protein